MIMKKEKILVVSRDHDFKQLLTESNVRQYDPVADKYLDATITEAKDYLFQHIVKGDTGDGVPNVLSADNSLVMGIRQRPITKKRIAEWSDINNMSDEVKRNYMRNKAMIDLSEIPSGIQETILDAYMEDNDKDRSLLLNYFIKNKLKNLMENITEF